MILYILLIVLLLVAYLMLRIYLIQKQIRETWELKSTGFIEKLLEKQIKEDIIQAKEKTEALKLNI